MSRIWWGSRFRFSKRGTYSLKAYEANDRYSQWNSERELKFAPRDREASSQ